MTSSHTVDRRLAAPLFPRPVRLRVSTLAAAIPTTVGTALLLLGLAEGPRAVAAPLCAILNIAVWFVVLLRNRDGQLPAFEIGTVCVGVTTVYSAYPLFAFLMAGGLWSGLSDNRLLQLRPDWESVGAFAWRNVLYLLVFALAYLTIRGRASADNTAMRSLSRSETLVVFWLFGAITAYFAAIWILFGVTYEPTYRDVQLSLVGMPRDLPYFVQQVSHNVWAILLILKLCGIAILLRNWQSPRIRALLLTWLVIEVAATALRLGARSDAVFLLLGSALLYHRIVRGLGLGAVAFAGLLLGAVLLYGFGRDFARVQGEAARASYWTAANEFQILFGTAYDLHVHKNLELLDSVPWQVYASDALRIVPSQLLPVSKIEPADWYLGAVGPEGRQPGLMFGVVAQAIIGYDWIELVLRGTVLGLLFALLHRFYVRNAGSFWITIFYLYMCLWSYYTFRASTFYFLYVILYRFLPAMIAVRVGAGFVRRAAANAAARSRLERQATG